MLSCHHPQINLFLPTIVILHRRRKVNKSGGAELMRERSDRVGGGFGRGVPNGEKF